ncbi:MAG: DUF3267 domain-containing protein [Ferruginibacter sp.]
MKLKSEELTKNNYIFLDKMEHKDLIPFVKEFLKKKTIASIFYYLSNIVFIALLLFFFMKFYRFGYFNINKGLLYLSFGIAVAFALIPIHEFIHVLAYKSQGAMQTSYDVNLKKFYFLAIADKFVANKKEFKIVALAPFIFISLILTGLLFFTGKLGSIAILTALSTHASFCSGDFALLSYFEYHKDKEVVTYDDKDNKISFFYGKTQQTKTIA